MIDSYQNGGITEEIIGVNMEVIKLIKKALPQCQHFIGTTCGMSEESCSGENESLGGTVQGIFFG